MEDFYIHGGDIIRIKHAESGGYLTIDENSAEKVGLQEAYVRIYKGQSAEENMTANQLFEVAKNGNNMEESGTMLQW